MIFGSSITYGAWDSEGGWANRLRSFLDQKNLSGQKDYLLLYNLGIDGDDTVKILKRFNNESEARLAEWDNESTVIIFEIGINDSCYRETKNNPAVLPEKFEENLTDLIKKTREGSVSKAIFLGLAKGSDKETMPFLGSTTGKCYDKENVIIYNDIIKKVCEKEKVLFIDILDKMVDSDFYDGLHPNTEGHQKIFEIVKEFLVENEIIEK